MLDELVYDSSLLRRYENDAETWFEMFIFIEIEKDKDMLANAFGKAARATQSCLADWELPKFGKRFVSWADEFFRYLPHSLSLVNHFTTSSIIVPELSTVIEQFEFAGFFLSWAGRFDELVEVDNNLLKLHRTIHGESAIHVDIARVLRHL